MKRTVRLHAFETNSSSAHAIVISDIEPAEGIDYNDYRVSGGKYDRYDKMLCYDTGEKLDYFWQVVLDNAKDTVLDEGDDAFSISAWREILGQFVPEARFEIEYDSYGCIDGYIDHGSDYAPMLEEMYEDNSLVRRFLLNPDSFVAMSSDEDCWPDLPYPDDGYRIFENG